MKQYNILVTGIGAVIGYGVIRSLRLCRYDVNIIGMDIYHDAVGQHWCNSFIQSILASDDKYCDFLSELMDKYNNDLVFLCTEQEIQREYKLLVNDL
jgi:carbamoyl-phosphate synthase large subunit